ncbi:hypothetical protein P9G84_31900 [Brevibacillus centrosporus]|uniref:hypothetical protein n=1 Tax=Brevibacillus centrosporus TaxID=54910 RepID=UPI0011439F01|nr:hypothetical protein [Brevibacillus centrosporus]MEC2133456.1 hypothetical protein [Brevibacillus centrosporus]
MTGNRRTVTITPCPFEIEIDDCIADEIVWLNEQGVRTLNSCCGHLQGKPVALIDANHGSLRKAIELGYKPIQFDGLMYEIELKGLQNNRFVE